MDLQGLSFRDWLEFGMRMGWIAHPVCGMHDTLPMSDEESEELDEGFDPCIPVLRIWREGSVDP